MQKNAGFTLIELMITLVVSTVILGGVYMSYASQQKSYVNQEAVAVMQQNIRAAEFLLERDLRAAGFIDREKYPVPPANLGFTQANRNSCQFTMDLSENGGIEPGSNEIVNYQLILNPVTNIIEIQRAEGLTIPTPAGWNGPPVADNIDALDFVYIGWVDNGSGVTLTVLNNPADPLGAVPAASLGNINSVQITIVARSGRGDPDYVDQTVYRNQQGTVIFTPTAADNNFKRRIITIKTQCRNLWYRS